MTVLINVISLLIQLPPANGATTFFSATHPQGGEKEENDEYALCSLEELAIDSMHYRKRMFSFSNMPQNSELS